MLVENAQHWVSKTVEGTYNTAEATGSNYSRVATKAPFFVLPKVQKMSDAGRSGQNAPTHLCNHYWMPGQYGFADDAETDVPARMLRRAMGGSVTNTLVDTGVYDHEFAILQPQIGSILPSFGMVSLLSPASFLLHGCMVDRFKLSQKKGDERAQAEWDIVNSGKFTTPHGLSSLPELAATPCMDAFRTVVSYFDTTEDDTVDFGALGTLLEWMVEHKNNLKTNKRRIGDTIQTVNTASAAHVRKLPRGKYETTAQIVLDFTSSSMSDWARSVENVEMQDLSFKVVGPVIASTYRHEFEIIVPRFVFDAVDTGDDDGDATTPINIIPLQDPTSKGTITARIRNGSATLV